MSIRIRTCKHLIINDLRHVQNILTERAGLDPAIFNKCLTYAQLTLKLLFVNEIHQSGCYVLVMSMSGHLGGDSGQNMDKTETNKPAGNDHAESKSEIPESAKMQPEPRKRRVRRKTKEEREKERQAIEDLITEAHKRFPRRMAQTIGAIYARYSSDYQFSCVDQIRELFEYAIRKHIFVPREHVYYDAGVTGRKQNREGLKALQKALNGKEVKVLLVFVTSRLFRKGYMQERFVEEEVVGNQKRCIFVGDNELDTQNTEG